MYNEKVYPQTYSRLKKTMGHSYVETEVIGGLTKLEYIVGQLCSGYKSYEDPKDYVDKAKQIIELLKKENK